MLAARGWDVNATDKVDGVGESEWLADRVIDDEVLLASLPGVRVDGGDVFVDLDGYEVDFRLTRLSASGTASGMV